MIDEELQNKIIENVKDKIAIFELEKEENKMNKATKKLVNIAATVVLIAGLSAGTAYAGTIIYEKIWKEPTRINITDDEITDEIVKKNISEDEAKKIAQDKLEQMGLSDERIIRTDHYRESGAEIINYRFVTKNWLITINGQTGEFYDLFLNTYDKSVEKYKISREEAIDVAKDYYKKFGYKEGEYEFSELVPLWDDGENSSSGNYSARFYKKYGDLYNIGESIWIEFYAKEHQLHGYRVENNKCENNPIEITKEKAIEIATNEDRKVESKPIVRTSAELRIGKMNANAYNRLNNTEEYYKPMTKPNVPSEEMIYYQTEGRIRNLWVVVLEYDDEGLDIIDKISKGQYSYFVDATTGEIIGGHPTDCLSNYNEQYKVK